MKLSLPPSLPRYQSVTPYCREAHKSGRQNQQIKEYLAKVRAMCSGLYRNITEIDPFLATTVTVAGSIL